MQRYLIFFENQDFEAIKTLISDKFSVSFASNSLYQKFLIKKEKYKLELYILPTDITDFYYSEPEIEKELKELEFKKEEILTFNDNGMGLYAYNIFPDFKNFLSEDNFFVFPDFNKILIDEKSKNDVVSSSSLESRLEKEQSKLPQVNLILTGSFSAGKTSFINTVNQIIVEDYNEDNMWLPAFDYETTFGIFKIHYKSDITKPILKNELDKEISSKVFPIGKNLNFLKGNSQDKELRLQLQREYFQKNLEINIEFPLKKEYQNNIFEYLCLIDTPGLKSSSKAFDSIKPYLNKLPIKGYLFLLKTSYTDESYLEKSTNLNENFLKIIQELLPSYDYTCVFDIFLNDDYFYKNLTGKGKLYNFDISNKFKNFLFQQPNLFPLGTQTLTLKFDEPLIDFFSESKGLVALLEAFYHKALIVEELKKLETNLSTLLNKKFEDLKHLKQFLTDLKPNRMESLDLRDFLLRLLRIFFNNYRQNYENIILTRNINDQNKKELTSLFMLFLDEVFELLDLIEESKIINPESELNINAILSVLDSLKILKQNFPDYFLNLKSSFIRLYKLFFQKLIENFYKFNFSTFPDFNDESEKFMNSELEKHEELKALTQELYNIRNKKEEEADKIESFIANLICTDKVQNLYNQILYC